MNWNKLSSRFKFKEKAAFYSLDSLDKKLVKNHQKKLFPNWAQFKYVGHFLTAEEKKIIQASIFAISLAAVFWGVSFVYRHSEWVPKDGGEYSEAVIGQPKYVNPLFSPISEVDSDLTSLIYSGLFRYDKNHELVPYLTESYTISEDKKIYDINLRKDARWSDGQSLDAADVIYTFDLIQNPEVGSPLLVAFQGVKIEKVGDYAIRFTLKDSFAPFLQSLTVGILPEHIWGEISPGAIRLAKNNLQPIGAGPWMFNKLVKDNVGNIQSYVLGRNENFFDKKPYIKNLNFRFYSDYDQAIEAVRSQNVSAISFVPRQSKNKLNSQNLAVYNLELPQYTALFFNPEQRSSLKSETLRRSLAEAIDKNAIIDEALNGNGKIIHAPILEGNLGYHPDIAKEEFDLDKANEALDKLWTRVEPEEYFKFRQEALFKNYKEQLDELKKNASTTPEKIAETEDKINADISESVRKEMSPDQSFYRQNKDKEILFLTITTVDAPEYIKVAELVGKMWNKLGAQTNIQSVTSHQIAGEILRKRSYDVLLYGEILGSDPDPFPFWHSSQINYPGLNLASFSNRNADKILEEARITIDNQKRS